MLILAAAAAAVFVPAIAPAEGPGGDETVRFTLLSKGAAKRIGYYGPQKADLSAERPATITKMPEGLKGPLFTTIGIKGWGPERVYHVVVDEPEGAEAGSYRLFVDSNGNGDLTDDGEAEWKGKLGKAEDELKFMTYQGGGTVDLGTAEAPYEVRVSMYRFDKTDERRTNTKMALLFYRDYATEGEVRLGEKAFKAMLADEACRGDFRGASPDPDADPKKPVRSGVTFLIDVNGNDRFDNKGERFDIREPFNIGGTTWELADIARDGLGFRVVKSDKMVDEIATPPDHTVGKPITPFEAKLMDGKTVRFPGDYKGKVVLLDFWATWCGPCIAEVPHVVAAYEQHRKDGFEVLGVTLDSEDMAGKITEKMAEKGMTWPQVYDGLGWKARIAELYSVQGIPAVYLVDGDTGLVLAEAAELRGEKLGEAVARAVEGKKPVRQGDDGDGSR